MTIIIFNYWVNTVPKTKTILPDPLKVVGRVTFVDFEDLNFCVRKIYTDLRSRSTIPVFLEAPVVESSGLERGLSDVGPLYTTNHVCDRN